MPNAALARGTGLEPGTSFSYNRRYQRPLGLVPTIAPKERKQFQIHYSLLADKVAVDKALKRLTGEGRHGRLAVGAGHRQHRRVVAVGLPHRGQRVGEEAQFAAHADALRAGGLLHRRDRFVARNLAPSHRGLYCAKRTEDGENGPESGSSDRGRVIHRDFHAGVRAGPKDEARRRC